MIIQGEIFNNIEFPKKEFCLRVIYKTYIIVLQPRQDRFPKLSIGIDSSRIRDHSTSSRQKAQF